MEKGGGVAPANFQAGETGRLPPAAGQGQVQLPGGSDLVVQRFHGNGEAPATTTVTSGSGKRLRNAVVNLIFWGDAWNTNPPPNPSLAQVVNDAASILAGPYQLSVSQYGATPARLGTVSFRSRAITADQLSDLRRRQPDHRRDRGRRSSRTRRGDNRRPAPGVHAAGHERAANLGGLHTYASYSDYDLPFDFDFNDRSHIAWVAFGNRGFISSVFSHELVEALTDPEAMVSRSTRQRQQLERDRRCLRQHRPCQRGHRPSYWSQNDQACVIPANIALEMEITCIHKNPRNDPYHPIRRSAASTTPRKSSSG